MPARARKIEPTIGQLNARMRRPTCLAPVHVSDVDTLTRRIRERQQRERCLPIDQCGSAATHEIDGVPYCRSHAATRALHILLGEEA
jgi:hypothetical protein